MRKIAFILVITLSFFIAGCWDAREINELGFVLSVGLDKTDYGFKVTAEIANPQTYSKTSGTGQKVKPFWIVSGTGKTIFEAIRNMSAISSRRIFWSHIKVILIGEQLAKEDTLEIFDFFSRNPELRLRTFVAITPGEAGNLLEVTPQMEKDPATYLEEIINSETSTGKSYKILLKDFLEDYLDSNISPVTSRIILDKSKSEPTLKTSGAYVFRGNKLADSLDEVQTRGLLWIKNKMNEAVIVVNSPIDDRPVTIEIKKSKSSFNSYFDNGVPNLTINVKVDAIITEQAGKTNYNDIEKLTELENAAEKIISEDIQSSVTKSKDLQVDFIGFSRVLNRQHKEEWHQISSNWHKLIENAQVDIDVKVNIIHTSLAKPIEPVDGEGAKSN